MSFAEKARVASVQVTIDRARPYAQACPAAKCLSKEISCGRCGKTRRVETNHVEAAGRDRSLSQPRARSFWRGRLSVTK